jgi:hypothetical protein
MGDLALRRAMAKASLRESWLDAKVSGLDQMNNEEIEQEMKRSAELTTAVRRGEACYCTCQDQRLPLIRSLSLERSRATAIVEGAVERVALNHALNPGSIDPPSKGQHVPRFGSNYEVLFSDCAFDTTRLIRSFEMTFDHRPLLL